MSGLSSQFEAHVALHRALGKRFDAEVKRLQDLDRFLARESGTKLILTQDVLGRWLSSKSGLATSSARTYASTARQFCRFLHRAEPRTWIPDRSFGPVRLVQSHPYVLAPTDVRALLDAALQIGSLRWPLRPLTFHTLILVLFTTGLRITEALSLRLRDVDLVARTLFISETKFFKSRWVPFSDGLAERLSTYLCARTACVSRAKPDDSFFISAHRKKFTYSPVAAEFDRLLVCQAIRMSSQRGRRGRSTGGHERRSSRVSSSMTSEGRISGSEQMPVNLIAKRGYSTSRSRMGSKAASCVGPCPTS